MIGKKSKEQAKLAVMASCGASALAAALLLPGAAFAQNSSDDPTPTVAEIVVTAERRDARAVETPISLTALSADQLASKGTTAVLDLTKVVPGLKLDQYGPGVFPAIRGITTAVSGVGVSSNVAVYMDGFYQPTPTSLNFEFADIDNVQVLKGPQGTLFGRNATGGAMLLTTKEPTNHAEGQVTVGYGTYDEKVANGYVAGPLGDRLTASVSASYRDSDGYTRNIVTGQRDGFYTGWNIRTKLKFEATDWLTLKLQAEHSYINDPMSMVYRVEGPNATADFVPGAIVTREYRKTSSDQATVLKKNIDSIYFTAKADMGFATLTSLTGYSDQKDDNIFDFDGSSLAEVNFRYTQHVKTLTQEVILAGGSGPLEWSLGGFYLHQNGEMPDEAVNGFHYQSAQVKTDAIAGYVDGTYNIAPKLYLTAGVRYSHEKKELSFLDYTGFSGSNAKSWDSVTPRAVIRYQINRDTSTYASYSKGFAAGVYSAFSPTSPPANPEKLDAYEIGFKHSARGLSFDLAGFYYKYSDMQFVLYTVGSGGVVSNLSNVGKAQIYGLEASLNARLNDAVTIFAGAAYTHSEYKDFDGAVRYEPHVCAPLDPSCTPGGYNTVPVNASGNQLIRTPKLTGNAGMNIRQPLLGGWVDLGGNLYFITKSYNDAANELEIAGRVTLDLNISWTSGDEKWKLAVIGKNVTDKHYINYWDPSNSALLVNDGAPRTVRATITRRF